MRRSDKLRFALLGLYLASSGLSAAQQPSTQSAQLSALDQDFKVAVSAYDSGRFAEAATQLEKLQLRVPKSFEVHELLGLAYAAQSQDARAIEQLQVAVELNPQSAVARTNLATAFVHAGKPRQAEAEWKESLALEPHDYSANRNLAELYLRENRVIDALPLLEAAQRIRPAATDNGYDLALADLLTEKYKEARTLIATLRSQHDSGELHNVLGRLDEKEGKFIDAVNEFATAAHMDPSEDNLFVWASELLLHRAFEASIDVFKEATQRFPASPRLWIGLGMGLYSRGEYEASIRSLLTAADLNPSDPRCYLFLSKAYLSSPGQAEDVIDRFRRYASLEPKNARAQYYYAISLWKGRRVNDPDIDYKAVESLLQKAISLDGTLAEAHLQLGILYNDEHAYAKSLPEYERAIQLDPGLADAHFRLGRYYLRAGDKDKAQTELDRFKQLQAQHQAEVDKERAQVQQFVVSTTVAPSTQP